MTAPHRPGPFTRGQIAVIRLSAEGLDTDEIAAKLCLAASTVKSHFDKARRRTGARDRARLVHLAWESGQIGDRAALMASIARLRGERDQLRAVLSAQGRARLA